MTSNEDFVTDMVGRRALSKEGHAAISMRGGDDRWIQIQKNTFTNWVNEQLREGNSGAVEDLQVGFTDGTKLCYLVESLQGKKIKGKVVKNPINQHQMLHNAGMALTAISDDNVKLVNIGPEDIVNGNLKLILGLIWHLILRYQIGKTKFPPKKLMLAWLQAVIPECQVGNFTRDWNDGVALHALLDYCKPGLAPDWRKLNRNNKVENCRNAMELAKQHFDIPLVLRPEDLSSPDLDELSGMTYLSYYMKYDSPGYRATLNWVRNAIPDADVNNFTRDWNDGKTLCKLVRKMGGGCAANPQGTPVENLQAGIDAGRRLGVDPILSAKELSEANEEHLGIMAYAASFNHLKPSKPPSEKVALSGDFKNVVVGSEKNFGLRIQDEKVNPRDLRAELEGPTSKVPVCLDWKGNMVDGHFRPKEAGNHRLVVYCQDEVISSCPVTFPVLADPNRVIVHKADRACLGVPTELKIDTSSAGQGEVTVEAIAPSGHRFDLPLSSRNGMFHSAFTPSEPGDWKINVTYAGEHVRGSPYTVNVYDPNAVKVYGLEGGAVGKAFNFTADCSQAGEGNLEVIVNHNGMNVPAKIVEDGRGLYKVDFVPHGAGLYKVQVLFNENEVKGSPYTLEIVDSNLVTASGEGLTIVPVNKIAAFTIDTKSAGGGDVTVDVVAPSGKYLPVRLVKEDNDSYTAEYTPEEIGDHNVKVLYHGSPVKGNPFQVKVYDAGKVIVHKMPRTVAMGTPVDFEIDASEAGSGNLEIMVNGGHVPCQVENKGKRRFRASFVPDSATNHVVEMKFNQTPLAGSPWKIGVVDPRKVSVVNNSTASLKNVPMHKVVSFYIETDGIPSQELDVVVKAPSGRAVNSRLFPEGTGYRVEYTPTEVGTYTVQIFFAGSPVAGTPFTVKSYDSTSIQVSQVPNGMVAKPVDFFIDVTKAGEGQLEIMINNGNLPNTVTHQRPGVYKVSFTPQEAGTHYVDILFNGERLPGAPYTCQVIDTSRVNVEVRRLVPVRESSHFVIQSQSVSGFDTSDLACVVEIISPSGRKVSSRLIGSLHTGSFKAEYMPMEIGTHKVNVSFGGLPIKGSPFQVKTFDASRVRVSDLPNQTIVGVPTIFEVDASEAGEGDLEVVITNNGMVVPSQARPIGAGTCEMTFVSREAGRHQVQVLYNQEKVPGSPFVMNVYDTSKISASGEGLNNVLCHRPTHFNIHGGGGAGGDIGVKIKGPDGRDLPVRVKESVDGYRVEWTPNSVGEHKVYVSYAEIQLKGSPYTPRVYDPSGIVVRHAGHGKINKPVIIHLDAAKAGAGNLEIFVTTSKGETVPNFVRQEGDAKYEVTFTPQSPENHNITVNFNGDSVPGSPFPCKITDNSRVHVSGDGLRLIPANIPTFFKVDPQTTDPGECTVDIISPSGRHIPNRVTGGHGTPFRVEYTPTETGQYAVSVRYDDTEVKGSPFTSDVYNPDLVRITNKPKAYLNKQVTWTVDTSKAGPGSLDVDLKCRGAVVRSNTREIAPGHYEVSFTPREHTTHSLSLLYNGDTIAGSPHNVDIIDGSQVSLSGEGLRTAQVYKESHFEIDPHGPPDEEVKALITGPSGMEIPCRVSRRGNIYRVDFTPHEVGPHNIETFYAGMPISGGPATCMTFDPSLVRITDVDKTGRLEREIGFIVDASAAGEGEVETTVTHYGRMVRTWRENVGTNRHRYIFVPTEPGPYDIDVRFNNERIPGTPLLIQVEEEKPTTIGINFQGAVAFQAQKKSQFLLEMDGKNVNPNDLDVVIRAPNGEQIPARIVPQSDGDYRVEWTPTIPGRYTIEVLFGGRKIQGSPFYVDVFDISRIRVENIRYGNVGEAASFDVDWSQAGKAEHTIRVVGPSGQHIPAEVQEQNGGQHVRFEPHEPGRYKIYCTYGGMDVPGSPFLIDVEEGRMPTANGDGLFRGEEDRPATFYVDARGLRGELGVQVEGPNSIAKCNIAPERDGVYAVTYVPVEVGKYRAVVKWNGKEIPGSPFHPKVVDPRKVKVTGGWQHYMDSNNRVQLNVDEEKRIPFDVAEAGPGVMTAEVRGPGGKIPCRIEESHHKRTVCFTPREEGDHHIYAYWSDHTLVNAPFHGYAVGRRRSPDPTKVVLSGRGLKEAVVQREAEFQIDGSEAGPGRPEVRLEGVKRNVPVRVSSLGNGRYRCTYIPESSGAYLLHINWNDRQLRGSPFKVHVINAHYPQKVVVTGEGLKGGVMGRDINVIIDTRKAGPGELTAHCMGPHKVAYCELEDMRDGTYKLNIRPQEPGRHILQIKYGGEHVLGSPYVLRVGAQPDASKVRVYGPGVENGVLATFQSRFIVETKGAGAGQLTVRIRGPKGAFQVEMLRDSQKDRTIMCRFDPSETGLYQVFVKWSGVDVPGSPFHVYIVDTEQDLRHIHQGQIPPQFQPSTLNRSIYNSEYSTWREDDGYRM